MKAICCALLSLLCVLALPVLAQDDAKQPWEEYDKLIKSREEIAVLGPTLFGDQVNLMNGALSFSMTDVSVPGNSASLPMAITRTYTVSNRKGYRVNDLPLADWDLDLPRISGVFRSTPPDGGFGTPCTATTATQAMPPQLHIGFSTFAPEDYWQGNQASMPGGGEMLLANAGAPAPSTGGPYYWMTSGYARSSSPKSAPPSWTTTRPATWLGRPAAWACPIPITATVTRHGRRAAWCSAPTTPAIA